MFSFFQRTKICTRCQAEKPLKEFPKWDKSPDGRNPWCLQCHREYKKAHKKQLLTLDFAKYGGVLPKLELQAALEGRSTQELILNLLYEHVQRSIGNEAARHV